MAAFTQAQINAYTTQIDTPAMRAFNQVKNIQTNEYNCYAYMNQMLHVVFPRSYFVINPQAKRPEDQGVKDSSILDFIVLDINVRERLFIEMKKGSASRQDVRHQLYRAFTRAFPEGNYAKFGLTVCGKLFWFWECYGHQQNIVVPGQGPQGAANGQPPGFVLMVPGRMLDNMPGTYDQLPDVLHIHGLDMTDARHKASILRLFNYISRTPAPQGNQLSE